MCDINNKKVYKIINCENNIIKMKFIDNLFDNRPGNIFSASPGSIPGNPFPAIFRENLKEMVADIFIPGRMYKNIAIAREEMGNPLDRSERIILKTISYGTPIIIGAAELSLLTYYIYQNL